MKKVLYVICTLTTLLCLSACPGLLAQSLKQHIRIQISYERSGQYLEQAVETIEASNTIGSTTDVGYQAGRSVILLPGFETKNGSTFTADIKSITSTAKAEFPLQLKAFPNPFDQATTIEYYLPAPGKVNLWITDAQGKIVGQLVQGENQPAGKHNIEWKPQSVAPGVYMPVVEANQQRAVSRLVKK